MTTRLRGARVWLACALAAGIGASVAPRANANIKLFTWTEIAAPAGSCYMTVTDLNNHGEACGTYHDGTYWQGYGYYGGALQTLTKPKANGTIQVRSINDHGVIVGETQPDQAFTSDRPAIWNTPAWYQELPRYDPPDPAYINYVEAQCYAINSGGQIANRAVVSYNQSYIYDVANAAFAPVGTWGTWDFATTDAVDINESGVFVGSAHVTGEGTRGLIGQVGIQQTDETWLTAFWAAATAGRTTSLSAVNEGGDAVGYVYHDPVNTSYRQAFLRNADGTITLLGSGGSNRGWAVDINSHRQIVGSYDIGPINAACLYSPNKGYSDLQPLVESLPDGYTLTDAVAINDHGQIAVNVTDASGATHALILNPIYYGASLPGASFDDAGLAGWQVTAKGGQAMQATDPLDAGNFVAKLVTGSPVTISQLLNTPDVAFDVNFRYLLPSAAGSLTVAIDDTVIGAIDGSTQATDQWLDGSIHVSDPALLGILGADLSFTFDDGAAGSVIYLDDIAFTPIPEPATIMVMMLGATALVRRGKTD